MTHFLFWIVLALYFAGWLGEFRGVWQEQARAGRWPGNLLAGGWGIHAILVLLLAIEAALEPPALLAGAAWVVLGLYFFVSRRLQSSVFHSVFPPLSIALLITGFFLVSEPLVPSSGLGSAGWIGKSLLAAHIVAVLGGTLLFGLACAFGAVYLLLERRLKTKSLPAGPSRLPALGVLERYNHKAILLGFLCLTLGILLGLVVAGLHDLWGRLLAPRQLIPLATWLIYAVFLLAHDLQGWRGRFGAVWAIAGFVIMVAALTLELFTLGARV